MMDAQVAAVLNHLRERQATLEEQIAYLSFVAQQGPRFLAPTDIGALLELQNLLTPMTPYGAEFIRVGGANDGGYVMVDRGLANTIAYNFGIGQEVTWDQAMAMRNNRVYQYDHTIDAPPPVEGETVFYRLGLGAKTSETMISLGDALATHHNETRDDLILNIDIEGGEWDILPQLRPHDLAPFSQIVMELHHLLRIVEDHAFQARVYRSLEVLFGTHQIVHVHANNYGARALADGVMGYDVLEVTLVRKADWEFTDCQHLFPRPLDRPNNPFGDEYRLGDWGHSLRQLGEVLSRGA
ncbi:hypothetical protein [Ferrimicrobium sp.]|uniref:hypothetical protein n=1 Tax=Ferrimicrobium sp. TaxID=2926050 RepID=UPI0026133231|nr:hypothetical protein [Ferrimicrobium sp.]